MPATRDATIDDALVLAIDAGAPMPRSWLKACGLPKMLLPELRWASR